MNRAETVSVDGHSQRTRPPSVPEGATRGSAVRKSCSNIRLCSRAGKQTAGFGCAHG